MTQTAHEHDTPAELRTWISGLIAEDTVDAFYNSRAWRHKRKQVLDMQHHECQLCRAQGIATPADTVHHIQYLRSRPDLALTDDNLMAVCASCHWAIHHPDDPSLSVRERRSLMTYDQYRQRRRMQNGTRRRARDPRDQTGLWDDERW